MIEIIALLEWTGQSRIVGEHMHEAAAHYLSTHGAVDMARPDAASAHQTLDLRLAYMSS